MKTPAADRKVLVLTAGVVWSIIGLILSVVGVRWIVLAHHEAIIPALIGIAAGLVFYRWKFSRLSEKNIGRISAQAPGKDKVCIFAFQSTGGYIMIAVMMLLGHTLRHLPIQKIYLAPLYLAIGLGLVLSSLQYYRAFANPSPKS